MSGMINTAVWTSFADKLMIAMLLHCVFTVYRTWVLGFALCMLYAVISLYVLCMATV